MAEENTSNLEPIKESDLDLAGKFGSGQEYKKIPKPPSKEAPVSKDQYIGIEKGVESKKEGSVEREKFYTKILTKVKKTQKPQDDQTEESDPKRDAEIVAREKDAQGRINSLVNLAQNKGVAYTVKVARHLEDNYTLDELHDKLLSQELHKALVEKGVIKEI